MSPLGGANGTFEVGDEVEGKGTAASPLTGPVGEGNGRQRACSTDDLPGPLSHLDESHSSSLRNQIDAAALDSRRSSTNSDSMERSDSAPATASCASARHSCADSSVAVAFIGSAPVTASAVQPGCILEVDGIFVPDDKEGTPGWQPSHIRTRARLRARRTQGSEKFGDKFGNTKESTELASSVRLTRSMSSGVQGDSQKGGQTAGVVSSAEGGGCGHHGSERHCKKRRGRYGSHHRGSDGDDDDEVLNAASECRDGLHVRKRAQTQGRGSKGEGKSASGYISGGDPNPRSAHNTSVARGGRNSSRGIGSGAGASGGGDDNNDGASEGDRKKVSVTTGKKRSRIDLGNNDKQFQQYMALEDAAMALAQRLVHAHPGCALDKLISCAEASKSLLEASHDMLTSEDSNWCMLREVVSFVCLQFIERPQPAWTNFVEWFEALAPRATDEKHAPLEEVIQSLKMIRCFMCFARGSDSRTSLIMRSDSCAASQEAAMRNSRSGSAQAP